MNEFIETDTLECRKVASFNNEFQIKILCRRLLIFNSKGKSLRLQATQNKTRFLCLFHL